MNAHRLAYKLLKNNLNIYGFYLSVLVVVVATYYNFVAIQYNEAFVALTEQLQSAVVASMTCGFVLLCTVVFFMWHANGFFFKQRQKETGLYMLMGISSSRIGRVMAIESILLGGLSLLIGLPVGLLFSKLFFMLLGKAMFLDAELPFTVSSEAILQLVIVFVVLFAVLGLRNYRIVKRSRLLDMLHAAVEKQSVPKLDVKRGFLGVLLITAGYMLAINFKRWELDLLIASMAILIVVCLGTYLFFGSFLAIILSRLMASKGFVYRDVRLVSLSNVFFRLKLNYRSLAMTAILAAATVTAFSVSLSFRQFAEEHAAIEAPYSLGYESNDERIRNMAAEALRQWNGSRVGVNEIRFVLAHAEYPRGNKRVDRNNKAILASYSEVKRTLAFLNDETQERLLEELQPEEGESIFILNANTMASPIQVKGQAVRLNGQEYEVKESVQLPFIGNTASYGKMNIYVVHDREYERLKGNGSEIIWSGIQLAETEQAGELVKHIAGTVSGAADNVHLYGEPYIRDYYALGIFFFLGLIMSLVFVLATFSTIYFKLLGDAFMDREQYAILKKIGMSKREIQKSVYLQVGIAFLLPVVVGMIHSIVAMNMLEEIMNVRFALQMVYGTGLFGMIMLGFYIGISRNYTRMVYGK